MLPIHSLNQIELATRWNVSPRTLERWRWIGEGPQFVKIGGRVVYRLEDIEAFEALIAQGNQSLPVAINPRERETLLNITGGLLDLLLGKTPAGKLQSVFESQAAVIDALLARYEDKPGIAKRTLEDKFAKAKLSLTSS